MLAGGALLAAAGARFRTGRRLAGAEQVKVGALLGTQDLPRRPVRVAGRIRCADPLRTPEGDRLVAYHRDVEVRLPGIGWRVIDRLRESRSFELWDHDGSTMVDPGLAAEPLIVIPRVWHGAPHELDETHRAAVERLAARHGTPLGARSTTRMLSVTDRLLVLAAPRRGEDGRLRLAPPPDGYIISAVPLADAMRLLGGAHRRLLGVAIGGLGAGGALLVAGLVAALVARLLDI